MGGEDPEEREGGAFDAALKRTGGLWSKEVSRGRLWPSSISEDLELWVKIAGK